MKNGVKTDNNTQIRSDEVQVLIFILNGEKYAINLFDVKEVVEASKITSVPHSPMHVRGIINLRGEVTTIINISNLLRIPENTNPESKKSMRFIVLDGSVTDRRTGVIVDDVTSVRMVSITNIDQYSAGSEKTSIILGILKNISEDQNIEKKELITWIDVRKLINGAE